MGHKCSIGADSSDMVESSAKDSITCNKGVIQVGGRGLAAHLVQNGCKGLGTDWGADLYDLVVGVAQHSPP